MSRSSVPRRFLAPLIVTAAVGGGALAGAALGVPDLSGAQESQEAPTESRRGDRSGLLAAAADALGIDAEDLATQLRDGRTIAEVAADQGVDVNGVIDAMVAHAVENGRDETRAREAITKLVNEGRPDGHGRGHGRERHAARIELDAAAEALGVERSDLVEELQAGKTIAQVAEEQGVAVETVIDAMVAPVRERITSFVNEGRPGAADDAAADNEAG